jgi:F-type H+-transporting ATPase subunit delta
LFESVKDASKEESLNILDNFSNILAENNQISQMEKILSYFNDIWNRENNILEAEIITARESSENDLNGIKKFVIEKAGEKEVIIKTAVNKNLKGGFVVRLGDEIFDSSLRNRISSLKKSLNN